LVREPSRPVGANNHSPKRGGTPVSVHHCDYPVFDPELFDESLNAKMALARQAVNLGRTLRAERNIKNRQPLRRLLVVARGEEQAAWLRTLEDLIRDELNVKKVEVSLDESSFVTYKAKANFKTLGPRLGKNMKAVAEKVARLGHAEIKTVLEGSSLTLEGIELYAGDLQVVREVQEGLAVTATPDLTVALDTTVDEPLKLEMLARETVSLIQNLRKESGLSVTDLIVVGFQGVTTLLRQAVETHLSYISSEVLAVSLIFDETGTERKSSRNLDIEGEQARIFVEISPGKDPA
jgi:isoleucyl-tRNA synthetase